MTNVRRLVTHLDETFAVCRSELGVTIRQLHEWTGEFPASTSGAGPSAASGRLPDVEVDAAGRPLPVEQPVVLTKVEADAENPDEARRALVRCYVLVDRLVVELGELGDGMGGETLPHPVERLAARLAFVQWQVNKIVTAPSLPRSGVGRLESSVRLVNELAGICATYRPAPKQVRPVDVCHAHEKAGLDSAIDSSYRRWHLCRWCGDFRTTHGVNPPPKLVRLHDRGISMSTSLLRAAGIRTVQSSGRGRS
jgi:hypothetical protein